MFLLNPWLSFLSLVNGMEQRNAEIVFPKKLMEKLEMSCRFKSFISDDYFTVYINKFIIWLLSNRGL